MLEHGGKLRQAAAHYRIPLENWIDLSTGINPDGYPVPPVSGSVWLRLPEQEDGLSDAACACYGAPSALPVAGTQAAIQTLPRLRPPSRVGVLRPTYGEHAHAWERRGHTVQGLESDRIKNALARLDVLVVTNPNNPTALHFPVRKLLEWRAALAARGGWLVVDEAYIDATHHQSLAPFSDLPGLVVLRSLGKFFGLAGARVGFVLAERELLRRLEEALGPWAVAHPSRFVAMQALRDRAWQASARRRLATDARMLRSVLAGFGLRPCAGTALFQWIKTPDAAGLHEQLAQRGLLTRLFLDPPGLRIGLPGPDQWSRVDEILADWERSLSAKRMAG